LRGGSRRQHRDRTVVADRRGLHRRTAHQLSIRRFQRLRPQPRRTVLAGVARIAAGGAPTVDTLVHRQLADRRTAIRFPSVQPVLPRPNALLVLALGRQLFHGRVERMVLALLAAAIFALHPAQTEAVTYISGRSVSLMSVFYLGALVAAGSDRRWLHFSVAPLGFAAALLVNETAWTLP